MKAILVAKRFADTGFELDVEFQETNGTLITAKTLSFSGSDPDLSMTAVKARVALEAVRLTAVLATDDEPEAALGTDLLA
jgi:hypothetical protein